MDSKPAQAAWGGGVCMGPGWGALTAFRLKVGDAVHDDMVEEEGLVVHLDAARQEPTEVMDVPRGAIGSSGAGPTAEHLPWPPCTQPPWPRGQNVRQDPPLLGWLSHWHYLVLIEALHGKPVQSLVSAAGTKG